MKSTRNDNQAGVVLVVVLVTLTLFGIVGLTFTYYTSETQCEQNPTAELRDGTCTRTIGPDRR
jgi:Tfp pilus assembly protein PilX